MTRNGLLVILNLLLIACIDGEDSLLSGENRHKYTQYCHPYLVSAGIENSIKYIFTMSPIMTRIATSADFIQCDVTYDESREYPYLFNAVTVNHTIMQWMVIVKVRMDKLNSAAYCLAFKKIFEKCEACNSQFLDGESLAGIVVDWSDAQISAWTPSCDW